MVRLASQIVLGAELDHLRDSLGYTGGGSWQACRDEAISGKRPTWEAFCKSEAGITEAAARIYSHCGEEVRHRVQETGRPGAEELLALMARPPSDLTEQERQGMIYEIVRLGINENETQSDIRKVRRERLERLNRRESLKPRTAPPADDDDSLLADNMESLALGAGLSAKSASLVRVALLGLKISRKYRKGRRP